MGTAFRIIPPFLDRRSALRTPSVHNGCTKTIPGASAACTAQAGRNRKPSGSVRGGRLFAVGITLSFEDVIGESSVDRALQAALTSLGSAIESAVQANGLRVLRILDGWFPMREISIANALHVQAAQDARSVEALASIYGLWRRSPDTPLVLSSEYAYFVVGMFRRERQQANARSIPLPALARLLQGRTNSILGTPANIRAQLLLDFLTGVRQTIWACQSARLLNALRQIIAHCANGCTVAASVTTVVSSDQHSIRIALRTQGPNGPREARYHLNAPPLATPEEASAIVSHLLKTTGPVAVEIRPPVARVDMLREAARRLEFVPSLLL